MFLITVTGGGGEHKLSILDVISYRTKQFSDTKKYSVKEQQKMNDSKASAVAGVGVCLTEITMITRIRSQLEREKL